MRIRILASLLFIGICLGNGDVSPRLTEVAKGLVEYVNNKEN